MYFISRVDKRVAIVPKEIFMTLHEEKFILRAITIIILLTRQSNCGGAHFLPR